MSKHYLKNQLFILMAIFSLNSFGFEKVEDGQEMVRVEIKFASDTSGIIEAYPCQNCPPKSYVFNKNLIVFPFGERSFTQRLKALNGKPVVLTWKPNTVQALRILPNF